jgi:hypothetical protein
MFKTIMLLATLFSGRVIPANDPAQEYQSIYVFTCQQGFARIYSDKMETLPLPNPFLVERNGTFAFYTPNQKVKIQIKRGSYFLTEINNCG